MRMRSINETLKGYTNDKGSVGVNNERNEYGEYEVDFFDDKKTHYGQSYRNARDAKYVIDDIKDKLQDKSVSADEVKDFVKSIGFEEIKESFDTNEESIEDNFSEEETPEMTSTFEAYRQGYLDAMRDARNSED